MNDERVLDAAMIEAMLALLPPRQQSQLFVLAMDETATDEQLAEAAREALAAVDWEAQRGAIRELIGMIMPLDQLVPESYAEWRPVIRDAVTVVGASLSPERLVPKLVEQMMLPAEMPLEQRLILLLSRMPSLQKIGQIVARNPHLDPSFRAELTRLENAITDVTPDVVRAEIERQLGRYLPIYQVELGETILAEASVSAVMRFSWYNPVTRRREAGVFKVLKPYILSHFPEEMALLQGLADFFDTHRDAYALPAVGFREVMDEVRRLLEREVQLPIEQANLQAASERYRDIPHVRVPRLIRELSTETITAMSDEPGVKITEAFVGRHRRRATLAARLVEALVAVPMFAPEERAFFHADPHAGNLFADERTRDVVILDWALTERLSRAQRRQTVLLVLAVGLRDERRVFEALAALSEDDLATDDAKAAIMRGHIASFFRGLSPLTLPGFGQVMSLLDGIAFAGIRFPAELLMFRKVLFTLEGVLHDLSPALSLDLVLARYAVRLLPREWPARAFRPLTDRRLGARLPLSNYDLTALAFGLPLLANRLWLRGAEQVADQGLAWLRATLETLMPSPPATSAEG